MAILWHVYSFQVYREFPKITEYEISDINCTGEATVEIVYMDGPSEFFELASLSYLNKGIDLHAMNDCKPEFDKITRNLQEKVTKLSCEVAEMDIKLQKQINDYLTKCQTIDENVSIHFVIYQIFKRITHNCWFFFQTNFLCQSSDNISILSRYGDFWIRNVNDHILIGIPVYNSSARWVSNIFSRRINNN